jgi:LacI family transcriptional regulator
MGERSKVVVLMDPARHNAREAARGFFEIAGREESWLVSLATSPADCRAILEAGPDPDALVDLVSTVVAADVKAPPRVPLLSVSHTECDSPYAVTLDDEATGRLAARYFLERGYRMFVWIGYDGAPYAARRREGFRQEVEAAGCACAVVPSAVRPDTGPLPDPERLEQLVASARHTPVAAFCHGDMTGRRFLLWCVEHGVAVPSDVAVLAVNDDELLCESIRPALSSIRLPWREAGLRVAEALAVWLGSGRLRQGPLVLGPTSVTTRQSTSALAVGDPLFRSIYARFQEQACTGASVADIVQAVGTSRRTAERLFRSHLHLTPRDVLVQTRIRRAKELLRTTRDPIGGVSMRCGFAPDRFASAFRAEVGCTPSEYRAAASEQAGRDDSPPSPLPKKGPAGRRGP